MARRALAEAARGRACRVGRPRDAGMPVFGQRRFALRIPGSPTGDPCGAKRVIGHDGYPATEIGQVGTRFDGLGHIGVMVGRPGGEDRMVHDHGFPETEVGGNHA